MPITQYRFLDVLNAANAVHLIQKQIGEYMRPMRQNMADLHKVLRATQDPSHIAILKATIAGVTAISELLTQGNVDSVELFAIIRAEKRYFDRVEKSNNKAAYRQKQHRLRMAAGRSPAPQAEGKRNSFPKAIPLPADEPEPELGEPRIASAEEIAAWQSGASIAEASIFFRAKGLTDAISEPTVTIDDLTDETPSATDATETITLPEDHPGVTEADIPIAKVGNIPPDQPVIPPDGTTDTSKEEKEPS